MRLDVAILDLSRTWRMPEDRPNIIEDTPKILRGDYNRIFEMVGKLPREQVEKAIKDLSDSVADVQRRQQPTTTEETDERTRQEGGPDEVRVDGDEALGGVPATDVQEPEGVGDTDTDRLRGPGEDDGSGDASTRQGDADGQGGDADARGAGTGPTRVDTAGSRGGTRERPAVKVTGNDFTAPEGFEAEIEKGGQKTKYRKNVAAVKLLKTLEAENRAATTEEKMVLAQYTGWGHTPQAFVLTYDERAKLQKILPKDQAEGALNQWDKEKWDKEQAELQELFTEDEYKSARASITNAHYTSLPVIRWMWDATQRSRLPRRKGSRAGCGGSATFSR